MTQEKWTPLEGDISKMYVGEEYDPVPRKVVTAANYCRRYNIMLVGARHWSKAMHAQADVIMRVYTDIKPSEWEQGFIDQFDQFLTREEAKEVALKNGQPLIGDDWGDQLYSENLH